MKCKYCQTEGHTYIYANKLCCESCYSRIFDVDSKFGYIYSNGCVSIVWLDFYEMDISIFFHLDDNKTVFVKDEEVVFELKQLMPITDDFFNEVSKRFKIWKLFS